MSQALYSAGVNSTNWSKGPGEPDTVIETRVEVCENKKLQWECEPTGQLFAHYYNFSQTFTSEILHYNIQKHGKIFFHKITRRKLKR